MSKIVYCLVVRDPRGCEYVVSRWLTRLAAERALADEKLGAFPRIVTERTPD